MYRKMVVLFAILVIATLACSSSGLIGPTETPRPTMKAFTVVPVMNDDKITPEANIGATPSLVVSFATDDGFSGHQPPETQPAPALSTPTASPSYEYFAFTADTCVGMDDDGKLYLLVRTSLGAGIALQHGLKFLSCWMDHPSDFYGYQWYTSAELPAGIKEVQLYEKEGIPSINYCLKACAKAEEPIWKGWIESSTSNQEIWTLDQKITNRDAFYPDGFVGSHTYNFYTR